MIDKDTALDAELFRRRHCDSSKSSHQCVGVITLKPGLCMFDCALCGIEHSELGVIGQMLDELTPEIAVTDGRLQNELDRQTQLRVREQLRLSICPTERPHDANVSN